MSPLDVPLPPVIEGIKGACDALSRLWRRAVSRDALVRMMNRRHDSLRPKSPRYAPLQWTRRDFVAWAMRNGPNWRARRRETAASQ